MEPTSDESKDDLAPDQWGRLALKDLVRDSEEWERGIEALGAHQRGLEKEDSR